MRLRPPYTEGTRLPAILYAYPLDYADASKAGQVSGTQQTFTRCATNSTCSWTVTPSSRPFWRKILCRVDANLWEEKTVADGALRRCGKYSILEEGSPIPFIVRWPEHVAPGISDALISHVGGGRPDWAFLKPKRARYAKPPSLCIFPAASAQMLLQCLQSLHRRKVNPSAIWARP
jgi:hypothetical protein